MKLKDLLFLVWYSIRDIILDVMRFMDTLKKPKTWSFILYAALFLIAYYRKLTVWNATMVILLILVIYVIRQKNDPDFNKTVKENAFLNGEENKIKEYYDDYTRQCYFTIPRKEPLSYEDYKQQELKKIQRNKEEADN